jgi:hypothetical protein
MALKKVIKMNHLLIKWHVLYFSCFIVQKSNTVLSGLMYRLIRLARRSILAKQLEKKLFMENKKLIFHRFLGQISLGRL